MVKALSERGKSGDEDDANWVESHFTFFGTIREL